MFTWAIVFKAPKSVRKSVEYVEEKIPILDNNSKDKNKIKTKILTRIIQVLALHM